MRFSIFIFTFTMQWLLTDAAISEPLRSIAVMQEMKPEKLAMKPEIEVDAVALCAVQFGSQFVVWQDGVGMYVNATWGGGDLNRILQGHKITPGDRLRIRGTVRDGDVSPVIVPSHIDWLGPGNLPEARPTNLIDMLSGRLSSQWVRIEGVVQAVKPFPGQENFWLIQIGTPNGRFAVRMLQEPEVDPTSWIDAAVSVRGTCMCFLNQRGEMMGVNILSNSSADISLLSLPPTDPFAVESSNLNRLQTFSPYVVMPHRRKISGIVTLCRPGSYLYLQQGDRGVKVLSSDSAQFRLGDMIEASGFVVRGERVLGMEHAVLRRVGSGSPPEPLEISEISPEFLRRPLHPPPYNDLNGRLVKLTGILELHGEEFDGSWLSVVSGGAVVRVRLPVEMRNDIPRRGSLVQLTGICELEYPPSHLIETITGPSGIRLLMRDTDDLTVLKAASWWTPQRLQIVVAAMATLLLLSLIWARTLKRKVRQRGMALASEITNRKVAETRTAERTRMAEELHDTIAQGLTGVSLQLDAARRATDGRPNELPRHLQLASQILSSSRDEIRRSLWNLRSGLLDTDDLIGSLESIAANLSPDQQPKISCRCVGKMKLLPEGVAHALLRIAQEALSNAVNHAAAQAVEAVVEFGVDKVILMVSDDGQGFDTKDALELDESHFGLQGMRGRARRLNGQFQIDSKPGSGTTIRVTFPYPHQDEPLHMSSLP